jgi:hypothetical protein
VIAKNDVYFEVSTYIQVKTSTSNKFKIHLVFFFGLPFKHFSTPLHFRHTRMCMNFTFDLVFPHKIMMAV